MSTLEALGSPDVIAPVLVTGATGNVGRQVVHALRALGVPFVAGGTDASRGSRRATATARRGPLPITATQARATIARRPATTSSQYRAV